MTVWRSNRHEVGSGGARVPGRRRGDEKGEPGTGNVVIAAGAGLSVMMMVEGSERYVVIGDRWPRGFESAADRPVIATKPSGGPGDAREEGLGPVQ